MGNSSDELLVSKSVVKNDFVSKPNAKKSTSSSGLSDSTVLALVKFGYVPASQPLMVAVNEQRNRMSGANGMAREKISLVRAFHNIAASQRPIKDFAIMPFFSGGAVAAGKELAKYKIWKTELVLNGPNRVNRIISKDKHPIFNAMAAATYCATVDTALGAPLDNWATYNSTKHGKQLTASLPQEVRNATGLQQKIGIVYRGWDAALYKAFINFGLYFTVKPLITTMFDSAFHVNNAKERTLAMNGAIAVTTGATLAIGTAVPDAAKTNIQMVGGVKTSGLTTMVKNVREAGLFGASAGAKGKVIIAAGGWAATALTDLALEARNLRKAGS